MYSLWLAQCCYDGDRMGKKLDALLIVRREKNRGRICVPMWFSDGEVVGKVIGCLSAFLMGRSRERYWLSQCFSDGKE